MIDLETREQRCIDALKAGAKPAPDVAKEFVAAKLEMRRHILADSLGGLLGADSLTDATMAIGDRYERALGVLEQSLGIEVST